MTDKPADEADDAPETHAIACSFWCVKDGKLVVQGITVQTTLDAKLIPLRNACQDHCRDTGSPFWAQPHLEKWLVYRMEGRISHLVEAFPNQDAAEMWIIHHAPR